jgi:hypothetical protein
LIYRYVEVLRGNKSGWLWGDRSETHGDISLPKRYVAAQFALAIVLLAGAGLMIRNFLLLDAVKPVFDTTNLLTMKLTLPEAPYLDQARSRAFFDEAIHKIEQLPGVRGAADRASP